MTVEIICAGNELLLGNTVNTNSVTLAQKCTALGLTNSFQSVVADSEDCLNQAVSIAMKRSDVVLVSGANGQARDNNWKPAFSMKNGKRIPGTLGGRDGLIVEEKGVMIILLPGDPDQLSAMFDESVAPYLEKKTEAGIYQKIVKICGIGEEEVDEEIRDIIGDTEGLTITTYHKSGELHLQVLARADDEKNAKKIGKPVVKELKTRLGDYIYATEDITLEQAVVDLLIANKLTVACAESCTGGMLSARLINVPGVSDSYKTGFVTYSNKAKRRLLGVRKQTLQKHGAVSAETAEEMAKGLAGVTKADVAVSVTGIAGPDGGTEEKPVGTVFICCGVKGKYRVKECHFSGTRQKVREASVTEALVLMRSCMLEYFSKVTFGE